VISVERKQLLSLVGGGILSLALIACSSGNSNANKNAAATAAAPAASALATTTIAPGGTPASGAAAIPGAQTATATPAAQKIRRGGTLNLASAIDAIGFDPMTSSDLYSGYVIGQVFEGLAKFDENYLPVPWLAEKWDISPDGKTYTFKIRKGVKFHDGTDVNAQAAKFSMDRIRNNKASVAYQDCGPTVVTDTQAPDDTTFVVTLVDSNAPFITKLGGRCGGLVSPTAVQKQGDDDFNLHPVGSGPFKFLEFKKDDHFSVVRNENYWKMGADGKLLPYLDKVNWRVITDGPARTQALLTGELDFTAVNDKDVDAVKGNPDLVFQQQITLGWGGFMLNVSHPPFNNKALAQAVAFAVDRDEVIRVIYKGLVPRAENGNIPPPLKWAVDPNYKPYDFDLAKAKAKLVEGGQPNGFSFTMLADTSDPVQQQRLELLQSELKKANIDMKIESGNFNDVVVPRARKGEGDAYQIVISGGIDPDNWTYGLFHTDASFNFPKLSDPAIDKLMEDGRRESDYNKRAEIYKQVTKLIMDYSPWVMINYTNDRFTGRKVVQGWYLGSRATAGYSEFWKTQE